MPKGHTFPTELTAAEQKAGFVITQLANPKGRYVFHHPTLDAVVRTLPGGRLAVKTAAPDGMVVYAIWDAKSHKVVAPAVPSFEGLMRMYP